MKIYIKNKSKILIKYILNKGQKRIIILVIAIIKGVLKEKEKEERL